MANLLVEPYVKFILVIDEDTGAVNQFARIGDALDAIPTMAGEDIVFVDVTGPGLGFAQLLVDRDVRVQGIRRMPATPHVHARL